MQPFSVEHIAPRSRKGTSTAENLAFACQGCNNHKYTRTEATDPATGDLVTLFPTAVNTGAITSRGARTAL